MGLKGQYRILLAIFALIMSQSCAGSASPTPSLAAPTPEVTLTATNIPRPTRMPISTSTPTITPTPVPTGVFVLFFYEPLVMNYDPSIWEDRSNYAEWGTNRNPATGTIIENYLQARKLATCRIGVQGPTEFNAPVPSKIVLLGNIKYEVKTVDDSSSGSVGAFYIDDESLADYDYINQLPVLGVGATPGEWNECKALAEEVLSTLHVP